MKIRHVEFVNLTPHTIRVGERFFPPSGQIARVEAEQVEVKALASIPVMQMFLGEISGLPEKKPGNVYIVSGMVLEALDGSRPDVVAPDTSPGSVIKEGNRTVGVKRFIIKAHNMLSERGQS